VTAIPPSQRGKSGYNECQNRHVRHWEIIKVILSAIGKLSTDKLEFVKLFNTLEYALPILQ